MRPLVISHGANAREGRRSRFHLEHDWTGTRDPSAWLCIPGAIREMSEMVAGGWPEIREHNRGLAVKGRRILCEALDPGCTADEPEDDWTGEGDQLSMFNPPRRRPRPVR